MTRIATEAVPANTISVPVPIAAALTGFSRDVIQIAIKRGELPARYWGTKPVVRLDRLDEWVESLDDHPPVKPE